MRTVKVVSHVCVRASRTEHSNHVDTHANSQRFYVAPVLQCVCLRHTFKTEDTFHISILFQRSRILRPHEVTVSFETAVAAMNSNMRIKICN